MPRQSSTLRSRSHIKSRRPNKLSDWRPDHAFYPFRTDPQAHPEPSPPMHRGMHGLPSRVVSTLPFREEILLRVSGRGNAIHKKNRQSNTRFDWRPDHALSVTSGTQHRSGPESYSISACSYHTRRHTTRTNCVNPDERGSGFLLNICSASRRSSVTCYSKSVSSKRVRCESLERMEVRKLRSSEKPAACNLFSIHPSFTIFQLLNFFLGAHRALRNEGEIVLLRFAG